MKKFYTIIAHQKVDYHYYGDCYFQCAFPIEAMIDINVTDDDFKVVIIDSIKNDQSIENINLLINRLKEKYKDKCQYEILNVSIEKSTEGQIDMFYKAYKTIQNGDYIYFDMTFGYKPTAMFIMLMCNYAEKIKKDTSVEKIYYALFNFEQKNNAEYRHDIIDVTSLYHINRMIDRIDNLGVASIVNEMIEE